MDEDIQDTSKETGEESFFARGYKDANTYSQAALRSVLLATRACHALPSADDFSYYATFPGFREVMHRERAHILALMSSLVCALGVRGEFAGREEKMDLLVDVNDLILENVSNYLDEASGLRKSEEELVLAVKPTAAIHTSWNKKQFSPAAARKSYQLLTAKNVARPQLTFKEKVDNTRAPFVPLLTEKPNSIRPLAIMLEGEEYCHPYEWEIEKYQPLEEDLQIVEPIVPRPLDETPLEMVRTEQQLAALCNLLKGQRAIAVDLEHHAYRSFQGLTCLMQISTREADYIVDVLQLRGCMQPLNDVFTDPRIVKVLHGADWDVLWLQRDLGLYLVGLFDTGQGARLLQLAHLSLSFLLRHYCARDLDKRFQLADWRVRPLPAEMVKYAREDTHYLLYVYDRMKNDLIAKGNEMKNLLVAAFQRSKLICGKKYQKPVYSDDSYLDLYKKSRKQLNGRQLLCLKGLHAWRDVTAREQDESTAFVLPNHMLLQIAEALPREQQGILACCNPIPPLVKQQLNELHAIILKASATRQVDTSEGHQPRVPCAPSVDLSSPVHCPHDIHHLEETHHHNGTTENVLPLITKDVRSPSLQKKRPVLSLLFKTKKSIIPTEQKVPQKVVEQIKNLIGPFERYKLTDQLQSKDSPKNSKSNEETQEAPVTEVEVVEETQPGEMEEASPDEHETLRKKSQKKKKKQRADPDITLLVPPPKKAPEVVTIEEEDFAPYDYARADCTQFAAGKKKSFKEKSKDERQSNDQAGKQFYGKKRKHAKQATFGQSTSGRPPNSAKWPKNR